MARVWLTRDGLSSMFEEAGRHAPDETGGLLLGYWRADDAVVMHVVGPGPNAIHWRDAYIPDYAYHESEVARLYAQTPWTLHYLGDWHTHPGVAAYLSERDKRALKRIASYRPARVPRPIMLILGFGPRWEPQAWQGALIGRFPCHRRLQTRPLELTLFEPTR